MSWVGQELPVAKVGFEVGFGPPHPARYMDLPAGILALCQTNRLEAAAFVEWCYTTGLPAVDATDALAAELAQQYLAGKLDYTFCDRAVNSIMQAVTSSEFFAASNRVIPKLMLDVYLAFDAGEFVHPGDQPHESPELKHTRPMLTAIFRPVHPS